MSKVGEIKVKIGATSTKSERPPIGGKEKTLTGNCNSRIPSDFCPPANNTTLVSRNGFWYFVVQLFPDCFFSIFRSWIDAMGSKYEWDSMRSQFNPLNLPGVSELYFSHLLTWGNFLISHLFHKSHITKELIAEKSTH